MKKLKKVFSGVVFCLAIGSIAIFSVPLCLCAIPIMLIWTLTDKVLEWLDDI